jgi:formate--tetrahydrofolate ligase
VAMEGKTRRKLQKMEKDGFRNLPVCMAKTQYSLSDDEELRGRPRGFKLIVTDVALSAGAGFVVILCGDIMTMPGLPRNPAAEKIDVTPDGEIVGLNLSSQIDGGKILSLKGVIIFKKVILK